MAKKNVERRGVEVSAVEGTAENRPCSEKVEKRGADGIRSQLPIDGRRAGTIEELGWRRVSALRERSAQWDALDQATSLTAVGRKMQVIRELEVHDRRGIPVFQRSKEESIEDREQRRVRG
ncbi:MAG: hypothetical protein WD690_16850 [Vicinamibacterales bacterium]